VLFVRLVFHCELLSNIGRLLHIAESSATPMNRNNDTRSNDEILSAFEVFVHGFAETKSRTHPYEVSRVGPLWRMRDSIRSNIRGYRKEEWVTFGVSPAKAHDIARRGTRGRYFICAMTAEGESKDEIKSKYKALGYRLLTTEPFFVHCLQRIPRFHAEIQIRLMRKSSQAAMFAEATRTRPASAEKLHEPAFRQYLATNNQQLVGWVRSVETPQGCWCSNMFVQPAWRRRGLGKALLVRMLRDDRNRGATQSVLLSSHTGALLYPTVGYKKIGTLSIFVLNKKRAYDSVD
jgi:GNAT superfamily N-acetyltransferase